MEVKDIITRVATLLQLTDLQNANLANYENLSVQLKKDVNLLISCINEITSDIASDYMPLKTAENIVVLNNKFDLTGLKKTIYKPIKLGENKHVKIIENQIEAEDGTYKFCYYYLPPIVALADNITCFGSKLTVFALCYGVCSEYCLICGNYSESEMWNSKFENAMGNACRRLGAIELKSRRWI